MINIAEVSNLRSIYILPFDQLESASVTFLNALQDASLGFNFEVTF